MKLTVLDIGGTSIKAGIFQDGILTGVREYDTNAKCGGSFVVERAKEILREFGKTEGIGISTAGQVDSEAGVIRYANSNIPGYTGTRLREIMEQEFSVPVAVENDVNAAAYGEADYGAGRGHGNFLCLTYGTGVGGAIVINKEVYKGSSFSAGEAGAMLVHPEDRNVKEDMFSGCYERYASTTALVKKAMEVDETLTNGRKIFEAMERAEVQRVVDGWIEEILYGLISLIHIFNPSCVILGGGVMKQEYVTKRIKDRLYESIMESYRQVEVLPAALGNEAGLFGAASCVLKKMKPTILG